MDDFNSPDPVSEREGYDDWDQTQANREEPSEIDDDSDLRVNPEDLENLEA
jgi:hypothetical protein